MPRIWSRTNEAWEPHGLDAPALAEAGLAVHPVPATAPGEALLIARPQATVFVNGEPVVGGIRVLDDRDEILVAGSRFAFSGESAPVVVPFEPPESKRRTKCGICRLPLEAGEPVVHCPRCDRVYHQGEPHDDTTETKPCWTYRDTCAFCGHPTALTGEPAWRPEDDDA